MTNDEFCNPTLKARLAAVSSLVFSFSPAFIYGGGDAGVHPSSQWEGGRRTAWTGHQDTHTHTLAVSHTHSPPCLWSVAGNQNGSSAQKGQSNLKLWYLGSADGSPSPQTREPTPQYFANTELRLCPTPGAGVHVVVKTLPANDSGEKANVPFTPANAHKHTIAPTGFSAQLQLAANQRAGRAEGLHSDGCTPYSGVLWLCR